VKYRPDVAYPPALAQEAEHFASGVNNPGEVRGLALSGRHVGITASELRSGLLDELDHYRHGLQRCFVDSGAFSEVKFGPNGREIVKPITDADWLARFAVYERIAGTFGPRAYVVAPDCVGDQAVTLERLQRYAVNVAAIAALRAQIIVPVQKGALPMSEMFRRACAILGLRQAPIAGVPLKKDATSLADLRELVESLPWFGARLHLLGLGPESKKFRSVVELIKSIRPNATITSDSVTIRRLVGRTNGRGNGPRALTLAQDRARAMGVTDPAEVKEVGLISQGFDEIDRDRVRAEDAGWFDVELYDSVEEARAHRLELQADRSDRFAWSDAAGLTVVTGGEAA
jgi:hypothetical protein